MSSPACYALTAADIGVFLKLMFWCFALVVWASIDWIRLWDTLTYELRFIRRARHKRARLRRLEQIRYEREFYQ